MINRTDIVEKVAIVTGLSKKNVEAVIRAFEDTVKLSVADGEDVNLSGFVKLFTKDVAARERVIPSTKETKLCPAHKTVKVKVLKAFKDCIAK